MAKISSIFAAATVAGLLAAGAANATVVTFDDLSGTDIVPDGYGGIIWNGVYQYYDDPQSPFTPASPAERAYGACNCLTDNSFFFAAPVTFNGAYFAGQPYATNDFELLLGGVVVATSASLTLSATPTFLASGYSGLVDQVDVQTNSPGHWVIDNITYNGVPEPGAWALMLIGFGLVGGALRRRVAALSAQTS